MLDLSFFNLVTADHDNYLIVQNTRYDLGEGACKWSHVKSCIKTGKLLRLGEVLIDMVIAIITMIAITIITILYKFCLLCLLSIKQCLTFKFFRRRLSESK